MSLGEHVAMFIVLKKIAAFPKSKSIGRFCCDMDVTALPECKAVVYRT